MILNLLLALAGMVIIFVIVVAARPAEYRIIRTASITAPPAVVFGLVNDFRKWEAWSPWEGLDPALKRIYEGASAGTGAIYSWAGDNKVGEGRMTITESRPSDLIRIKLEFLKPFKATNPTEFTFKSEHNHTVVSWTMTGRNNFLFKAAHLLMNMEKMLGNQFDQGLAQMKALAEAKPQQS